MLSPNAVIGIVGGGQLGRMSAMAAARLGFRSHILAHGPDDPGAQVSHAVTVGAYNDPAVLRRFAEAVDVITFEFENIPAEGLDLLSELRPVHPSGHVLRISQDREQEKTFLESIGVDVAPWRLVTDRESLGKAADALGYPFILKTTRLGYDGKGQRRVTGAAGLEAAFEALAPKPLVAEALVDFGMEVSVMVARGQDGTVRCFDVTENRHRDGILDLSFAPARIEPALAAKARETARRIAVGLDLIGILGVEMFIGRGGEVLVNEIAPRPHNSGHWTMDACPFDQFEMHIRAVAGLPLPEPVRHSDAVMKNLVGPDDMALWPEITGAPGLIPHLYGKREARKGRKMGHVNVLFARGALPGEFGMRAALGPLAEPVADLVSCKAD
ncbi:5-(carboxyamino)imidazole ribonucleotide synthase [Acetobacter oeni]|uniref:N5-carboxyaminoimidazole ribonucleotide synthase n=1 Tax=Acetobacter oeni TaxID=304077 RepID=A0A511XHK0_9PROT|nr:5-(carboxyamino)imidazole ribonucleotide synthase [Acetobacter oeni]MBB3881271.1 5-(carboxyamino)imidazole ribonucleotide synthase [Acetobacter oeni]NHO18146.1 5-(carboxyamino)imidazole ribonucleotide synthase [Acetobacter oeni]GBR08142.1 phosphoribosylaminoimidazole carboxylase ATPase subunit [Acetobacter oeni LMG 21952]GEN62426.1 N5-carboxyaminoimidazole ribonucleotide synthase [Acetobacter oeni]